MSGLLRRFGSVVVSVLLVAGLVPLAGSVPAQAAAPASVKVSTPYPVRGAKFTVSGRLRTHVARPVSLQRRSGSKWVTITTTKASASGRYRFVISAALSSYKLRVVAKKTRIGKRTYARLVSRSRSLRTVKVSPTVPIRGERFTVSDLLGRGKKVARPVVLQRRSGKKWVTVASGKTSKAGVFSLSASTTASSVQLRVVAKKTRIKGKSYRKVVTKTATVKTAAQSGVLSLPATGVVGAGLVASLSFSPARAGRAVRVETLAGGVWKQSGVGVTNAAGKASVAVSPTTTGTVSFRGVAAASNGAAAVVTAVKTVTVTAGAATPAIVVSGLSGTVVDGEFQGTLSASGGVEPYRWAATGLPGGVSLDAATGVLGGTPTTAGTFSVTITVTDAHGVSASTTIEIVVRPLVAVETATLPDAVVDTDYSFPLAAVGGTEPFSWSGTGLPAWLSLDADGMLTGTPTATGTETFTVTVTDANHKTASRQLSITVGNTAGPAITTTALPDALIGTGYSTKLLASGGTAPLTWSATGLPGGFTIDSSTGRIVGTPTQAAAASVQVTLTDADARSASSTLALTTTTRVAITSTLPDGHAGVAYNATQTVVGGTSPYVWSATGLPDGLSLDTSTGAITGTPTAGDARGVAVTVTDARGHTATVAYPVRFAAKASLVVAGSLHSCMLTDTGAVMCWGHNNNGQLGDGTNTARSYFAPVSGLSAGATTVANGDYHSCALTSSGGVKCWGANGTGQLGNGSTTGSKTPVDVTGLDSGVVAIEAGGSSTCALTSAGAVKCWGLNNRGQLGDGGTVNSSVPVDVSSLASGVASVHVGSSHACALTSSGAAKCWGYNNKAQLGNGATTNSSVPVDVTGLSSGVTSIAPGEGYTCALISGAAKCWGAGTAGQLGYGGAFDQSSPTVVSGLATGVAALASAYGHSCVLLDAGGVKCWGADASGQLGDGTVTPYRLSPVDVINLGSGVTQISVGGAASCALFDSGVVKCWGDNTYGDLGDGAGPRVPTPGVLSSLPGDFADVRGGGSHSCGLTTGGAVQCWGSNATGQIGDGTTTTRVTPVGVTGLGSGVTMLAAGQNHNCVLTDAGGVKCWGGNTYGVLGDGTTTMRKTAQDVPGLTSGVASVSATSFETCVVTSSGGAKCWGQNSNGQLGDGTTTNASSPVDVSGLSAGVSRIVIGTNHACALMDSGSVKCWGANSVGQLGDGTTVARSTPADVPDLPSGVVALSAMGQFTCALTSAGAVKCWGYNAQGQVGDGSTVNALEPVDVTGLAGGVVSIAAGSGHSCALTDAGRVKCWGSNAQGQVGDGTTRDALAPAEVPGLTGVSAVFSGTGHAFAMTSGGQMVGWGSNSSSQLGYSSVIVSSPTAVVGLG